MSQLSTMAPHGKNENINTLKYQKNGVIGILTRKYVSIHISRLLGKTPIMPDQVTFFSLAVVLAGCYFISTGLRLNLVVGGVLIFLGKVLDSVDGELARLKKVENPRGAWLDGLADRFKESIIILSITLGLYNQTGEIIVWYYGFIAAISLHMLAVVLEHTGMMDKSILRRTQEKTWVVRLAQKGGIKPQFIALQADTYLFITSVLIIANQLRPILWLYIIVMNLYWLLMVIVVYRQKGVEMKTK